MPAVVAGPAVSPVLFFGAVLFILAMGCLGAYVALGYTVEDATLRARRWTVPYLDRQRALADALGWGLQRWVLIRVIVAVLALLAALSTHIFIFLVGGVIMAYLLFPWIMGQLAEGRQLKIDRAMTDTIAEILERMESNRSWPEVARAIAENPRDEVASILEPLLRDQPRSLSLIEVAERSHSPLVAQVCRDLMLAERDANMIPLLLRDNVLPNLRSVLAIQQQDRLAAVEQRGQAYAMIIILVAFFLVMQIPAEFHAAYQSTAGQVVIVICSALGAVPIWLLEKMRPRTRYTEWDLRGIRREFNL
jgi:Flp pilus assembly protein TadB